MEDEEPKTKGDQMIEAMTEAVNSPVNVEAKSGHEASTDDRRNVT